MIGIGRSNDGHVGMQTQEGAIELIGFGYKPRRIGRVEKVGIVAFGNATQQCRAANGRLPQQMRQHSGNGGFSMRSGHSNGFVMHAHITQQLRPFYNFKVTILEIF